MAITSDSTQNEVLDQYNNNLTWEGNITKATLALAAVRWLLVNRPEGMTVNGRSHNYSALEQEKEQLENFVSLSANTNRMVNFTEGKPLL